MSNIDKMKYFSAMKNMCGIDLITIMGKLNALQINSRSQSEILSLIVSDDYYNKVNDLYNTVKDFNAKTIDCALRIKHDGTESQVSDLCSSTLMKFGDSVKSDDIDIVLPILQKYNNIISSTISQVYNIAIDSQRLCGKDTTKLIKLRLLISKLALILVDKDTLTSVCTSMKPSSVCPETVCPKCECPVIQEITCPKCECPKNTLFIKNPLNINEHSIIFILIFLVVILVYFINKK